MKFLHLLWVCFLQDEITPRAEADRLFESCRTNAEIQAVDERLNREFWLDLFVKLGITLTGITIACLVGKWLLQNVTRISTFLDIIVLVGMVLLMVIAVWPWRHTWFTDSTAEDAEEIQESPA